MTIDSNNAQRMRQSCIPTGFAHTLRPRSQADQFTNQNQCANMTGMELRNVPNQFRHHHGRHSMRRGSLRP